MEVFPEEAGEVGCRLGRQVVEVESMSDRVNNGEEDAPAGGVLVERHQGIQRDVVVD